MAEVGLTSELKRFIAAYIPSLEHLEILLLSSGSPETAFTLLAAAIIDKNRKG